MSDHDSHYTAEVRAKMSASAREAWARRRAAGFVSNRSQKRAAAELYRALSDLRQNANRLCDRNLGGTYEDDCRRSIVKADAALRRARGSL